MKKDIVAVVLAGGVGKRFWPFSIHKSLFSFLGRSLVSHNLEMLQAFGISKVVVVVPEGQTDFHAIAKPGMSIQIIEQVGAGGMGDAMVFAKKAIGSSSCLVLAASDIVEMSLFDQLKVMSESGSILIAGKKMDRYFDGGYLKFDSDRLVGIVEKPGEGKTPSEYVNLVFHYFPNPSLFLEMVESSKSPMDDVYEKALTRLVQQEDAKVIAYDGYWQPFKYPWHVLDAMDYFLKSQCTSYRGKNIEIKSNVIIEGAVHIEDNVRIFENTKIVGPCYIGHDTIIGNNNIIRHSHIGAGCVTGFNTDITRSYVGDACWFHSNYIGDSVLEGNISLGSGTVLANLRLDEGNIWSTIKDQRINTGRAKLGALIGRDVRIGVNTSIMPGVKIGKHSFVGAGMVVDKDVPDNSFCFFENKHIIKSNTHGELRSRDEFKHQL